MRYQVIYESETGNTERVARAIAECFHAEDVRLVDMKTQTPDRDADVYCIGFGVRHSTCSMRLLEFLELLNGKTILLFATCGMNPTNAYHDVLERNLEPFLPENCDYRGLYLCQGSLSDAAYAAIMRRFENNDDEETMQRLEEFRIGTYSHPDESDLENARKFVEQALDLW